MTALASGATITLTPDTLKYDIQEGEDLICCFKVSGTGSNTGDVVMNVQNLQVTVTVNEDNAISVSSVTLGAGTATSTGAMTINHSVGAAQCTGNTPAIGGEVCLELTTEGAAFVNTVSAWTFSHGATTFTAVGKLYTDVRRERLRRNVSELSNQNLPSRELLQWWRDCNVCWNH
jgi:hypothetical protein